MILSDLLFSQVILGLTKPFNYLVVRKITKIKVISNILHAHQLSNGVF